MKTVRRGRRMGLFQALSDGTRIRILRMLQTKPLCVCEITALLDSASSTVSKHLRILRDAGFVVERKDGKWINYHINSASDDPRVLNILTTLDFWIGGEPGTDIDRGRVRRVDRAALRPIHSATTIRQKTK